MEGSSENVYLLASNLIETSGTDDFIPALLSLINSATLCESVFVLHFHKHCRPSILVSPESTLLTEKIMDEYLNGFYMIDPFYNAFKAGLPTGLHFIKEVAPDDFFESTYYTGHYCNRDYDEAAFVIELDNESQIQISLTIIETPATAATRERLHAISPLVISAYRKHWQSIENTQTASQQASAIIHEQISSVFKNFGYGVLTERETELAILIIRGYSLIAIAELLGIAHGTAKVHCKNLYSKLEINSKSELFSLFLDQISLT
ncbi:LuxR family transcriptional regulator [uncultured Amphritea sp.]|uniref:helix-turn-helix transcriptional regulator n=1 Tax=Amphritea sp. TaxID=1872502 RepID=UPI0025E2DAEA|nr:LuxR family transcriptional regulator [uncultured Amphritea sp.]